MADWIKRALTRTINRRGPRNKTEAVVIQPDERLVYAVKFAVGMSVCLSALEVAHMAFLKSWNSEVFAAITGLIGTVAGILVGQKT
jgi:hypothetical protein